MDTVQHIWRATYVRELGNKPITRGPTTGFRKLLQTQTIADVDTYSHRHYGSRTIVVVGSSTVVAVVFTVLVSKEYQCA